MTHHRSDALQLIPLYPPATNLLAKMAPDICVGIGERSGPTVGSTR